MNLTLSLDFQGVVIFKIILPYPICHLEFLLNPANTRKLNLSKFKKWAWIRLNIQEYPSMIELGFSRNSNYILSCGFI